MKKIIVVFLLLSLVTLSKGFATTCADIDGTYEIQTMSTACTEYGIGYFPGEDSGLNRFMPSHKLKKINEESKEIITGIIEPDSLIEIKTKACSKLDFIFTNKDNKLGNENLARVKMTFNIKEIIGSKIIIQSTLKSSGCDYGVCGKTKTKSTLELSKENGFLSFDLNNLIKRRLFLVPLKKIQNNLKCSFRSVN